MHNAHSVVDQRKQEGLSALFVRVCTVRPHLIISVTRYATLLQKVTLARLLAHLAVANMLLLTLSEKNARFRIEL